MKKRYLISLSIVFFTIVSVAYAYGVVYAKSLDDNQMRNIVGGTLYCEWCDPDGNGCTWTFSNDCVLKTGQGPSGPYYYCIADVEGGEYCSMTSCSQTKYRCQRRTPDEYTSEYCADITIDCTGTTTFYDCEETTIEEECTCTVEAETFSCYGQDRSSCLMGDPP